eukprot:scaffold1033_cov141-Skeletonema_marinoi.AAC.21
MSQVSFRTLRQSTRQQAAVRRSPRRTPSQRVGPPSILRSGQQRNNIRRVMFTATCTSQPFHHTLAPDSVLVAYEEEVLELELPHVEVEAQEEEEGVQFEDAGHVPEESVEQRKRTAMGREVAALSSNLGVYWSQATHRRLRRSRRSTKAPERFVPTF